MNNEQRLEASELMTSLKEAGFINGSTNLGQFVTICFFRGLNEYRKELFRHDWKSLSNFSLILFETMQSSLQSLQIELNINHG